MIIFSVWFAFSTYVNILENKDNTGIAALKTSKDLVKGRWGKTFWRLILPFLLIYIIVLITAYSLAFVFSLDINDYFQSMLLNSAISIALLILSPLFISFNIILYQNLKNTKTDK